MKLYHSQVYENKERGVDVDGKAWVRWKIAEGEWGEWTEETYEHKEPEPEEDSSVIDQVFEAPTDLLGKETTVGDYLQRMLALLWEQREWMPPEHGWQQKLITALVKADIVEGEIVDGRLERITREERNRAKKLISDAIGEM